VVQANNESAYLYIPEVSKSILKLALKVKLLPRTDEMNKRYKNPDGDPRGPWQSGDLVANEPRKDGNFIIQSPITGKEFTVPANKHWVYKKENLLKLINDKRIWFGKNGNSFPRKKRFLHEVQQGRKASTLWLSSEVGHNQEGKRDLLKVLGRDKEFNNPKPVKLIMQLIRLISNKNDIILDSFAGSATTAHAVLNLNKEDGGNRKFILVELEDYADSITAERVKRVIDGYGSSGKEVEGTGGGFTFYELGEPLFLPDGSINKDIPIEKLREYIYFTEAKKQLPESYADNPYYLGSEDGNSYYLLHGDETPMSLNYEFLSTVKNKDEAYIIYADRCLVDDEFLRKNNIIFKKVPRDIVRF
jgi:adenine-specific DNA-methyltransferase